MELFTFQDIILFATFLITLLAYIDRKNKCTSYGAFFAESKKMPTFVLDGAR